MISSQSERTCPSSISISNLYESSDQVNHFKSDSYYKEGIAGGNYFNDGNEEDCNLIDDQGVEALKVFQV